MTLIEQRGRAIEGREEAILRGKSGLEVGGVVNGVRPGVGGQEFVVAAEALTKIGGEPVIDRTAVRVVGVHVAEGDAIAEGAWVAVCIEVGRHQIRNGVCHARREGCDHGGIQAGGPEQVHQRGRDVIGQSARKRTRERAWTASGDE